MANVVGEMVVRVGADTTRLTKGLNAGQTKMNKFAQSMGQMGRKMTMGFSLPVAAVGAATVKMAMDFESQMTDVFTLMDDATIASRNWSDEILDLSKKVPQSTDVLSKGLYDIISSGIDAGEAMEVLGVSSKAATAGLSDTATAVTAITSVLNAYGLEASEATNVADTLFTTVKTGVTTFPELASSIGRVISTASAANVSFDEVGISLATMTQSGLSTEEAVVALNQVILSFLKPGSEAQKVAEKIGFRFDAVTLATEGLGGSLSGMTDKMKISIEELVKMEEAGMAENEIFQEMETRLGLATGAFAKLFPNVRALKGFLALTRGDMEAFNANADEMAEKTGSMMGAFEKQSKTAKFQWDLTLSSLKATGIEIGNIIMPSVMKLVEGIGHLADKFGDLSPEMQGVIVKGVGLAAMIPILAWAASGVVNLVTKFKALSIAIKGIAGSQLIPLLSGIAAWGGPAAMALGGVAVQAAITTEQFEGLEAIRSKMDAEGSTSKFPNRDYVEEIGTAGKMLETYSKKVLGVKEAQNDLTAQFMDSQIGPKEYANLMKILVDESRDAYFAFDDLTEAEQRERIALIEATGATLDYMDASGEAADSDTKRLKALEETIHTLGNYALAHEELLPVLRDLDDLYANGYISIGGYETALKHLMDTGGSLEDALGGEITSGVQLADNLGILEDEYYDAKEAREAATGASEDHATAMNAERRSMEELLTVMFTMYNQNATLVEQIWAYQDAQKRLQDYLDKGGVSTGKLAEAEDDLAKAQAARADELDNLSSSDAEYQKLLQEHHELTKAGTIVTRESELKMSEITAYMQGNTQAAKDLAAAEQAVIDIRAKQGTGENELRNTREYAELTLAIERDGQTIINTISQQVTANEELDASTQYMVDNYQSVRDAVIHILLGMRQSGSIGASQMNEWASNAGIAAEEIINYWTRVKDAEGMIPNVIEIDIMANDLTGDMVEEIVGDLNDLEKRPTTLSVEIETRAAEEKTKEGLKTLAALGIVTTMAVDTYDAEESTDSFIYGPWNHVETEVDVDTRVAEGTVDDFINRDWGSIHVGIEVDEASSTPILGTGPRPMGSYKYGGIEQASDGLNAGGSARPVMIHPPELILNKDQALNALWNMANGKQTLSKGGKLDLSGKIQIQVDGEGASHLNESLVSDLVTDKIIRNIKEEGARS